MPNIIRAPAGIKLPSTLGTNSVPGSEYAIADGAEIKGHPIQVETQADLYGWPVALRQWGQYAYVVNDPGAAGYEDILPTPAEFRLDDAIGTGDLSANVNWVPLSGQGSGDFSEQRDTSSTVLSGRAVRLDNGAVRYAQPTAIGNVAVIGISLTSATAPNPVTILTLGKFIKSNTFPGPMFWLGDDGTLLGLPPVGRSFLVPLGRVLSSSELFFNPLLPIQEG